jgi:hypothetical protein
VDAHAGILPRLAPTPLDLLVDPCLVDRRPGRELSL